MRLAHDSRTPLVSWRFLGISELSLALFPQEQPCRNPQQQIQCGCTQAKLDVPEETRSRVKSAFIPQKRHDLGTIWDKPQIFSNIWVQPAYKDHSREKHLSCAWYWEAKNKKQVGEKSISPLFRQHSCWGCKPKHREGTNGSSESLCTMWMLCIKQAQNGSFRQGSHLRAQVIENRAQLNTHLLIKYKRQWT